MFGEEELLGLEPDAFRPDLRDTDDVVALLTGDREPSGAPG
jgi:hypothetical protein